MGDGLTLDAFDTVAAAFGVDGLDMRTHKGRSVVLVNVAGKTHYLKRFWLCPTQILKRHVARGLHEMRMIDWLNGHRLENRCHTRLENRRHTRLENRCPTGFAGPRIVRRGSDSLLGLSRRVFFLMEEIPDELPLEASWRRCGAQGDELLRSLAARAARLHDAGFCHTDFSERHILVGRASSRSNVGCQPDGWTFRLIDVERGHVGRANPTRAAADLATLAASVSDDRLRKQITTVFLDDYIAKRRTLPPNLDFRALFARATPTRSFH